jgi:hypothetical protein
LAGQINPSPREFALIAEAENHHQPSMPAPVVAFIGVDQFQAQKIAIER